MAGRGPPSRLRACHVPLALGKYPNDGPKPEAQQGGVSPGSSGLLLRGGRRPTAERDHAPARIVFRGKHGPDDFAVPACASATALPRCREQVTAFYILSVDQDSDRLDEDDYRKLIGGIVNDAPDAVLCRDPSRGLGPYTRVIALDAAARIVSIPEVAKGHITLFETKILDAMHYRVTGRPAYSSLRRLVYWAQAGTPAADQVRQVASQWFDDLQMPVGRTSIQATSSDIRPATSPPTATSACICRSARPWFCSASSAPRAR